MRLLMGGDDDDSLLPDDIPSDTEFDDYTFGTSCCVSREGVYSQLALFLLT
jgi:hypothetical protein